MTQWRGKCVVFIWSLTDWHYKRVLHKTHLFLHKRFDLLSIITIMASGFFTMCCFTPVWNVSWKLAFFAWQVEQKLLTSKILNRKMLDIVYWIVFEVMYYELVVWLLQVCCKFCVWFACFLVEKVWVVLNLYAGNKPLTNKFVF